MFKKKKVIQQTYVCVQPTNFYPQTLVVIYEYAWSSTGMSTAQDLYNALNASGYNYLDYDLSGGRLDAWGQVSYFVNVADLYIPQYKRIIFMFNGWVESYFGLIINSSYTNNVNYIMYGCSSIISPPSILFSAETAVGYGFVSGNATLHAVSTAPAGWSQFDGINITEYYCWDVDPGFYIVFETNFFRLLIFL